MYRILSAIPNRNQNFLAFCSFVQYIYGMIEQRLHCCIHIPSMRLQVAEYEHPELAGRPFAIASQVQGSLAIVEALSPAARRLRIPQGVRISDLQSRWPQVSIIPPALEQEQRIATELEILADTQTPAHHFEDDSLFLDLSGTSRLHGSDHPAWAQRFLTAIAQHTGLQHFRIAFAESPRTAELLARATRQSAPIFCPPGQERELLSKIPLRFLHRLPPRIHTRFRLYNLSTLADIQKLERQFLQIHFGPEGEQLYALAQGLDLTTNLQRDNGPLCLRTIFPRDTANEAHIHAELHKLCDKLAFTLRQQRATAKNLRLLLLFSDGQESSHTHKWDRSTNDFQDLLSASLTLLKQAQQRRVALRSIELVVTQPQRGSMQIDLFQADGQKQASLGQSIDKVRQKLGFGAVLNGNALLAPSTKQPSRTRAARLAS